MKGFLGAAVLVLAVAACTGEASQPLADAPAPGTSPTPGTSPAPGSSASVLDLGSVAAATTIEFDVAPGTLGFNVVVSGDESWSVGVASLVSPSGVASVTGFRAAGSTGIDGIGSRGLGAFSVPQTDATAIGGVEPGRWHLVVGGIIVDANAPVDKSGLTLPVGTPVTAPLHVTVTSQRTDDGAFHGGAMDLHVYIPDGLELEDPGPRHSVHAAEAAEDRSMQKRIDAFYSELDRLFGIGRGEVTFHSIDARWLHATDGPTRAALIQQANAPAAQALHVVYTNELSYGSGGDSLLGYSVGLPGAANTTGTFRSSITVATYAGGTALADAVTMVHEMGHFVGLRHSTEFDGTPDLLTDTPTCGAACGVKDPVPDANNLMYPEDTGEAVVVTPEQQRVVRGSAIYRAHPR